MRLPEAPTTLEPVRWRENDLYLFAADLYNEGFLWEAHEAWEPLWQLAKRRGPGDALFFKALIQVAAAWVHRKTGNDKGFRLILPRATGYLERVAEEIDAHYMGLDLAAFVAAQRTADSHPPRLELGPFD